MQLSHSCKSNHNGVCTWDQLPRDQLPCDQLLWDQLFMKSTLIKSTLSWMPKVVRYWCVSWPVDLFDRYWVVRFSVFKPLIFSTMHTHPHLGSVRRYQPWRKEASVWEVYLHQDKRWCKWLPILEMPKPQGWLLSKSHFRGKECGCKEEQDHL